MNEYKHVIFNPILDGAFEKVIENIGPEWALSHIVHHSPYQSIAVFERWVSDEIGGEDLT